MKHNMKIHATAAAALCILLAPSCDNSLYKTENLYPDEYKNIVSFQAEATSTDIMRIYDVNIDITQTVTLLRGGSDPSLTATAKLRGMTDDEAASYVKEGIAIAPQYYTISEPDIVLAPEERYRKVDIVFSTENIAGIRKQMEANPESRFYIALILDGLDNTYVNEDKCYFVREIELGKPVISITGGAITDSQDSWSVELSASMDGDNIWDFDCTLERNDDYVEDYNTSLGRDYNALSPESVVSISNEGKLSFKSGESTSQNTVTLTVSKAGFNFDSAPYVLPIAMNMGELEFEMERPYYMVIEGIITLTLDMLSCPFDLNGYDGQGLAGLIDGDVSNTYWHTPYNDDCGAYYKDDTYGHYFEINLGKQISKMKCRYYNRPGQQNNWPRDIDLYTSNDGETWTLFQSETDIPEAQEYELGPYDAETPFSYLRVCVKKNQQGMRPGIDQNACSHMTEFQLFGI